MKRKLMNLLGIVIFSIGFFLFLSPTIFAYLQQKEADQEIEKFEAQKRVSKEDDPLYKEALEYDQKIYDEEQSGLQDAWSYKAAPIKLKNEKKSFGYIKIKKMNVKLPLYLGATLENMRRGAAIMGQTSLPLGKKDSNCVIAAHRGYEGIPYFREIERLNVGDSVIIKNPWQRLSYKVERIKIIRPDDTDSIKIQKGKDMITLLTCHPYRSHGKYRYVVYCVRDRGQKISNGKNEVMSDTSFQSSQGDIQREKIMQYIGILILACFVIGIVKNNKRRTRNE